MTVVGGARLRLLLTQLGPLTPTLSPKGEGVRLGRDLGGGKTPTGWGNAAGRWANASMWWGYSCHEGRGGPHAVR